MQIENVTKAMSELRKTMLAAEAARASVAALLKAGLRGGEAVATAMHGLIRDQMKSLQAAQQAVDGALVALVASVTPPPTEAEKKPDKA